MASVTNVPEQRAVLRDAGFGVGGQGLFELGAVRCRVAWARSVERNVSANPDPQSSGALPPHGSPRDDVEPAVDLVIERSIVPEVLDARPARTTGVRDQRADQGALVVAGSRANDSVIMAPVGSAGRRGR